MMKTIEDWMAAKKTPDWLFNAARASTPGWARGREVDEATYDKAIEKTGNHKYHAHPPPKAAAAAPEAAAAPPDEFANLDADATPLKGTAVIDDRPAKTPRK